MLGALDMFGIGIGPSSSHTIGPMKAALQFVHLLEQAQKLDKVTRLEANLYGSLALTGEGHGTVLATLNGLCGEHPKTVDPDTFLHRAEAVQTNNEINLLGKHLIEFNFYKDMLLHKQEFLPQHANGMRFIAYNGSEVLFRKDYFSIGGGFILDEEEIKHLGKESKEDIVITYPFKNE